MQKEILADFQYFLENFRITYKKIKLEKLEEINEQLETLKNKEKYEKYDQFDELFELSEGEQEKTWRNTGHTQRYKQGISGFKNFEKFEMDKKIYLEEFLIKFSFVQLQCICTMNGIFIRGYDDVKSKLIVKIINNSLEPSTIDELIERSKNSKFIVECNNYEYRFDDRSYLSNENRFERELDKKTNEHPRCDIFDFCWPAFGEKCIRCNRQCELYVYLNVFCEKNEKLFDDCEFKMTESDNLANKNNQTIVIPKKHNINKKKPIPPKLKEKVWSKYVGDRMSCLCPICEGVTISTFYFECAHVVAEINGGLIDVNNLRAICGSCNKSMNSKHMKNYVEEFYPNAPILSTFT